MRNLILFIALLSAFSFAVQASRKMGESSAARERRQLPESSSATESSTLMHKKKHMHAPFKTLPTSVSTSTSRPSANRFPTGTVADFEHITHTVISSFNVEAISEDPVPEVGGTVDEAERGRHLKTKPNKGPDITYHGGPVMSSGAYLYLIFASGYSNSQKKFTGNGWPASTISSVESFFNGISKNSVFQYLKAYGVKPFTTVLGSSAMTLNTDNATMSNEWAQVLVQNVVQSGAVKSTYLSETIFHVLSDTGLVPWNDTDMCVNACGWHMSTVANNQELIYTWIPHPLACAMMGAMCYVDTYPVNDAVLQGLISIMYHETVEGMTDPFANAWWDSNTGEETEDECAWNYGPVKTYQNSSCGCQQSYNTIVSGQYYLIQGTYAINGAKQLGCKWS